MSNQPHTAHVRHAVLHRVAELLELLADELTRNGHMAARDANHALMSELGAMLDTRLLHRADRSGEFPALSAEEVRRVLADVVQDPMNHDLQKSLG